MDIATGLRKARRYVSALSLGAMLIGMLATNVASAATYADVPSDAWFYTYVEQLASAGILDTTQANYRPADHANRAEAAKLLVEAAGLTIDTSAGPSFKDVAPGAWYYQYVETAAKNGLVGGYKDAAGNLTGYFGPGDQVTREQFSKMAVSAFALAPKVSGAGFPDVSSTRWSHDDVMTLWNWSVVDGYPNGMFMPENPINRAEIAKMVVGAMNPVSRELAGAFTVQLASATSPTMVDVQFSQDVEEVSAAMMKNYSIKDAAGNTLAVTAATVAGDKVTLTTGTQTKNTPYTLTVDKVMSKLGKALDQDTVTFNGYNPVGPGGPLTVTLDPNTPAAVAAPKGAAGIVFTCFNFTAGADAVVLESLSAHRTGAGAQSDLDNVYLYNGARRITTGRTVNSDTQMVTFSNINQTIAAGGVAKICVVGDFALDAAPASVHAFEIVSANQITTNASSVSGTFPLKGNPMTVAGGTVGTVKVLRNGSLDQITVGQKGARIAQFQLQADSNEDQSLQRAAFYIRGSIRASDLKNLALYANDGTVLAKAESVAENSLVTFVLDKAYEIKSGDTKNFYITSDIQGRNADDIKTYIDEPSDLLVIGKTFGFGVQVNNASTNPPGYNGADPDSTPGNTDDQFSYVSLKGTILNISFNGPSANDIAIGQQGVHCLDMTITNTSDSPVDIKNWKTTITTPHLYTGTTPNFTNIKLVQVNKDGSTTALLDDANISTTGVVTAQTLTFAGTGTIPGSSSIDAAIIFDVSNAATNGETVTCTLEKISALTDGARINNDVLAGTQITPDSTIVSNTMTISSSALTIDLWSTPSTHTYTRGTKNAPLLGLSIRSGSAFDNTITQLNFQGYVDGGTDGFSATGVDTTNDGTTNLKDIVDYLNIYNGTTALSTSKKSVQSGGTLTFQNIQGLVIPKGQTVNITLQGDISNSAPFGALSDRIKFGVVDNTQIIAQYNNGNQLASGSMTVTTQASNGGSANTGTIMTISSGGTGNTGSVSSDTATVVTGELVPTTKTELARWRFTANAESPMLKDLQIGLLNKSVAAGQSGAPVNAIYLYSVDAQGNCTVQVGSSSGYTSNGNGIFSPTDINATIPDGGSLTLCALATINQVGSSGSEPLTGSNVGAVLLNITEVQGASGTNVSNKYAGDIAAAAVLSAEVPTAAAGAVTTGITTADAHGFVAGDVVVVDQEMMLVLTPPTTTTLKVVRGFGNTTPALHAAGRTVGLSYLAVRSTELVGATAIASATATCLDVGAAGDLTSFKVGDVLAVTDAAPASATTFEYMLVTDVSGTCAADSVTVKRGMYGSTALTTIPVNSVITRLPLHGNMFTLRRSKPKVSLLPLAVNNPALPGGPNTKVLAMRIAATGQDYVTFNSAKGGRLEVTLSGTLATAPASCKLTDNVKDYSVVATPTLGAVMAFTFEANELSIAPGGTPKDLYVECDTTGGTTSGNNLTASLVPSTTVVTWNEDQNLNTAVTTDGKLVITTTLQGPTLTKP